MFRQPAQAADDEFTQRAFALLIDNPSTREWRMAIYNRQGADCGGRRKR